MISAKPSPRWVRARFGAIDTRAHGRASLWTLGVVFFTFLALMWHPLLSLVLVITAIAFRLTTRRRICDVCGYDGREDTRRGFHIDSESGVANDDRRSPS
jgi:hypothetical protein